MTFWRNTKDRVDLEPRASSSASADKTEKPVKCSSDEEDEEDEIIEANTFQAWFNENPRRSIVTDWHSSIESVLLEPLRAVDS